MSLCMLLLPATKKERCLVKREGDEEDAARSPAAGGEYGHGRAQRETPDVLYSIQYTLYCTRCATMIRTVSDSAGRHCALFGVVLCFVSFFDIKRRVLFLSNEIPCGWAIPELSMQRRYHRNLFCTTLLLAFRCAIILSWYSKVLYSTGDHRQT